MMRDNIKIELHHGDCLPFMRTMESKSVDLIFSSPPYNMRTRVRNGRYTEREQCDHFSKKYARFHDAYSIEEYYAFHKQAIAEMLRISHLVLINIQIVTGSKEAWFKLIGDYAQFIRDVIVWDKGEGQPAMHGGCINKGSELILCMESDAIAGRTFNRSHFERGTMPDIWRNGRGNSEFNGHNAVFPTSLPARAIMGWTQENGIVFDPFMGTGTTGVACMELGRNFIGAEIDGDCFRFAQKRIKEAQKQQSLFRPEEIYQDKAVNLILQLE